MTSKPFDSAVTVPEAGSKQGGARRICPNCGKPEQYAYRPFCSKRCADVDLNRWLSGAYAIPERAADPED